MKKVDPFAQAPEFLAAVNNIATNGFFEKLDISTHGHEGILSFCLINATGCVPNNKKYFKGGVGMVVNPEAVIASCKSIAGNHKIRDVSVTVKTCDWILYNNNGDKILGSKGMRTEMNIRISFAS